MTESDLEGGPLRYAVAGAYKVDLANFDEGAEDGWARNTSHGLEVDGLVKSMGFSMHVMGVLMKLKSGDPDYGVLVQPGYMIVPKKLEVAGRFSLATEHEDNRNHVEARAAVNYFIHGNAWRLAGEAGFLQYTGDGAMDDKPDLLARVQLQMQI